MHAVIPRAWLSSGLRFRQGCQKLGKVVPASRFNPVQINAVSTTPIGATGVSRKMDRTEGGDDGGAVDSGVWRRTVTPASGGPPLAHYTPGILVGDTLYISGQLGVDASGNLLDPNDAAKQTEKAMQNMGGVLKEAGMDYTNLVKCTIFLANLSDGPAVNEAYKKFLPKDPPARSAFAVAGIPKGGLVEIEGIAVRTARCPDCKCSSK